MQIAAPPGEQPRPTRPPTVSADGYGDTDHDDAGALGVDVPTSPPPNRPAKVPDVVPAPDPTPTPDADPPG